MILKDFLAAASKELELAGIPSPALDARLLIGHALDLDQAALLKEPTRPVSKSEQKTAQDLLDQRRARKPVARILGQKEFWSLPFEISPHTLDPRPDSETLIEAVLDLVESKKAPLDILDVGTGSGCLLLTLLHELPKATGVGVDIDPEALTMARRNAEQLGLAERCRFQQSNWLDKVDGYFHLIISNPPYIPSAEIKGLDPEVKDYDPPAALDGGADGLDAYRAMAADLRKRLARGGVVVLEVGDTTPHPAPIMAEHHLVLFGSRRDLSGTVRCYFFRHEDTDETLPGEKRREPVPFLD